MQKQRGADTCVSERLIGPDMSLRCSDACSLLAGRRANMANTCPKHAKCKTWRRIRARSALCNRIQPICHRLMLHCKVNAGYQTPSILSAAVMAV